MNRKTGVFDLILGLVMLLVILVTVYPFYYALIYSFNDGNDIMNNGLIFLWPRVFTLDNYKTIFSEENLLNSIWITAARTVLGTALSVLFTAVVAYPLSKPHLAGRRIYLRLGVITMYFSGGIIPFYMLLKSLGLTNRFAVFIFPTMFSFFNAVLFINFFREIPPEMDESAKMDGAGDWTVFWRIALPVSAPVMATISLFNGVNQWNAWFDSAFYTTDKNLKTLQYVIYELVNQAKGSQQMASMFGGIGEVNTALIEATKYATMVVAIVPIACVYPFLQRFFVKGMMVGSVKG